MKQCKEVFITENGTYLLLNNLTFYYYIFIVFNLYPCFILYLVQKIACYFFLIFILTSLLFCSTQFLGEKKIPKKADRCGEIWIIECVGRVG